MVLLPDPAGPSIAICLGGCIIPPCRASMGDGTEKDYIMNAA
jgi:hypothetical protein